MPLEASLGALRIVLEHARALITHHPAMIPARGLEVPAVVPAGGGNRGRFPNARGDIIAAIAGTGRSDDHNTQDQIRKRAWALPHAQAWLDSPEGMIGRPVVER